MTPDEQELLRKTYELSEENHKILKGIRNSNRWASFFRFLYWVIIIGVSVGAFYFLQPYVNNLLKAYTSLQNDLGGIKSVVSTSTSK